MDYSFLDINTERNCVLYILENVRNFIKKEYKRRGRYCSFLLEEEYKFEILGEWEKYISVFREEYPLYHDFAYIAGMKYIYQSSEKHPSFTKYFVERFLSSPSHHLFKIHDNLDFFVYVYPWWRYYSSFLWCFWEMIYEGYYSEGEDFISILQEIYLDFHIEELFTPLFSKKWEWFADVLSDEDTSLKSFILEKVKGLKVTHPGWDDLRVISLNSEKVKQWNTTLSYFDVRVDAGLVKFMDEEVFRYGGYCVELKRIATKKFCLAEKCREDEDSVLEIHFDE